jgi:Protein of unknown function (DUF3237)
MNASALQSRHLFTITMTLHPYQQLGATPAGNRRIIPVAGGDFVGDRLRGDVLPLAGSDLLLERADGSFQQDVRLMLKTHDEALILMTYRGIRHATPDVSARLARGETVSSSEYYLRTAPFFETSAPAYAWLNTIVTIGVGERRTNGVRYEVFEIL